MKILYVSDATDGGNGNHNIYTEGEVPALGKYLATGEAHLMKAYAPGEEPTNNLVYVFNNAKAFTRARREVE